MVVALMASTAYVLQLDDSAPRAKAPVSATAAVQFVPVQVPAADTTGREYFIRRHEVIPLGTATLRLPILMYHYIRPQPSMLWDPMGFRLSVEPDVFNAQLDWLAANGYHTVTFDQIRAYFAGTQALPSRPVVITLDDGYRDLYTAAYPLLRAHAFTAVAYIVPNFVDRYEYVTRDQILDMDHGGIEIASHTMNHANLAGMSFGGAMYELVQSKHWLEGLLGHSILDFAYPSGKFNALTVYEVQQAGYDTAVTEQESLMHSRDNRYTWARTRVGGGESLADFITNLGVSMPSVTIQSVSVKPGV